MRYALSDYIVAITLAYPNAGASCTIGGQGSDKMLESISISKSKNLYDITGFATGGFVHNKSNDKTGTVTITISQLSDACKKLHNIYSLFEGDANECTIAITDKRNNNVATCNFCTPQNEPSRDFRAEAGTVSWVFNVGEITFF